MATNERSDALAELVWTVSQFVEMAERVAEVQASGWATVAQAAAGESRARAQCGAALAELACARFEYQQGLAALQAAALQGFRALPRVTVAARPDGAAAADAASCASGSEAAEAPSTDQGHARAIADDPNGAVLSPLAVARLQAESEALEARELALARVAGVARGESESDAAAAE